MRAPKGYNAKSREEIAAMPAFGSIIISAMDNYRSGTSYVCGGEKESDMMVDEMIKRGDLK